MNYCFLQVTKNMDGVVKGLDKAMQSMDLEKVNYTFVKLLCVPLTSKIVRC